MSEIKTILIVEDEKALAEALRDWYSSKKIALNLLIPEHSNEAFTLLQNHSVDLLITDEVMPGTRGSDLIESMLEDQNLQNIPVILISGTMEESLKNDLKNLPMNIQVLSKPFRLSELDELVLPLLETSD